MVNNSALIQTDNRDNSPRSYVLYWRIAQAVLLIIGVALVYLLFFMPTIGINLLWNLIIPVAPLLVLLLPGVWRNICPMGSVGMLPSNLGISRNELMSDKTHTLLSFISLILLLVVVVLRHLYLNLSGPLTGAMLVLSAASAFLIGMKYSRKSGWCSALCPIHPVERLYGVSPIVTAENAHCHNCVKCWSPCPDSVSNSNPSVAKKNSLEKLMGLFFVGGFFGFIYGWYQVPDYEGAITINNVITAFAWPFGCGIVSLIAFLALVRSTPKNMELFWIKLFATAAISCYYWYRVPMLFGVGLFPGQGMLIDLSAYLPSWFSIASQLSFTAFFVWFIMIRKENKQSWLVRPKFLTESPAS